MYASQVCGDMQNSQLFHFDNQVSAESDLSAIFNITSSSQDCANKAMTFFCNATYRLCTDATSTPSTEECEMLANNSCISQWSRLQNISILAKCSIYNPPPIRTCPDQLQPSCDGACVPICSEFSQNSEGATILVTVITGVISNCGNVVGGILVFVIAFFKRKTM